MSLTKYGAKEEAYPVAFLCTDSVFDEVPIQIGIGQPSRGRNTGIAAVPSNCIKNRVQFRLASCRSCSWDPLLLTPVITVQIFLISEKFNLTAPNTNSLRRCSIHAQNIVCFSIA